MRRTFKAISILLFAVPLAVLACSDDDSKSSPKDNCLDNTERTCDSPSYECDGDKANVTCSDGWSCYVDCTALCEQMGGSYVRCGTQEGSTHDQCLCQQ